MTRKYVAAFLGTFLLVLAGTAAIVVNDLSDWSKISPRADHLQQPSLVHPAQDFSPA